MAIDLMGPRFYTQQMSASKGGSKKAPARQKKHIVADIQHIVGLTLPSLINVTKPTLEVLYDALQIQKG